MYFFTALQEYHYVITDMPDHHNWCQAMGPRILHDDAEHIVLQFGAMDPVAR
jgi:hypothetical protein